MARLVVSLQAERDIVGILELLTGKAGISVARRYREELERLMDRLATFPSSGARRPELGDRIRIGVVSPYVLIYDERNDMVRVLRVLDGRRQVRQAMLPP